MFDTYDNSEKIIYIPIKDIKPNPYKARRFYDITSVSALADSIKEIGLLQPILVRRIKQDAYELISGERRLRACEIAGLEKAKCIVLSVSDNQSAVYTLAENIQQKDVHFFDLSSAFYHLLYDHKISKELLLKRLGLRQSYFDKMLKLYRLSSTIKNIIIENGLTEECGFALLSLTDDNDRIDALKYAIEHNLTDKEFSDYISKLCEDKIRGEKKRFHNRNFKYLNDGDYNIVFNTLNKAIKLVSDTGIKTRAKRFERENYYEYVIRICK